jgi:hypothetical protein
MAIAHSSSRWRIPLACAALIVLTAAWAVTRAQPTAAAPSSQLTIDGPTKVTVGQPIQLTVVLKNVSDVAGYQVTVQFDTSVAHLNALTQRDNDLKKLGRSVETLGPIESPTGVTFGAYSCPYSSCADTSGKTKVGNGGKGTVKLATFAIVVDKAGPFTIQLSSFVFTTATGATVPVNVSSPTIEVQVQ